MTSIDESLDNLISRYQTSFTQKIYTGENDDSDPMMDVFAITPELKRENRQYWGRELGMCWQLIVTEVFRQSCNDFGPAIRIGTDEPCDFTIGTASIDTKYRIGSGDSGTLKKFRQYGELLVEYGYEPILLIARDDNLPAAIRACIRGGWVVHTGDSTFEFIKTHSGFDLKNFLVKRAAAFRVHR